MRIIHALLMFFFVFFLNFCLAHENFDQKVQTEKVYVSHDQIFLTDSAIYIKSGESLIPVNQINCDSNGMYILPYMAWTKEQCRNGHNIRCRRCYGCDWRRCEYACKCR